MMHGAEYTETTGGIDGRTEAEERPTSAVSPTPMTMKSPLAKAAAGLLHKRFRVTVADGRVLVGSFICLDQQGNIILDQTVERYQVNGMEKESMLGQVLIPRPQRVACEVEVVTAERSTIERLVQVT